MSKLSVVSALVAAPRLPLLPGQLEGVGVPAVAGEPKLGENPVAVPTPLQKRQEL